MNSLLAEFVGTTILVLLGNGVVANVCLDRTKGRNGGWIVITAGWGLAVFIAVACTEKFSGAHLNPAVTIGLAMAGKFAWTQSFNYIAAQMGGAFFGAVLVYIVYKKHYDVTDDADIKLGTFCNSPAIPSIFYNLFGEAVGTFILVFTVLMFSTVVPDASGQPAPPVGLGAIGALPVGLLVFSIGMSLGGTTGYAINPARDLSPRIAHAVLPIRAKRDSNWSYAWIPVAGPILGGFIAAFAYQALLALPK